MQNQSSQIAALVGLTVEHEPNPIAIAVPRPRFGWKVTGGAPAEAHRIVVERAGTLLWDSGRREGPGGIDVEYSGAPLPSDADFDWRVRVWIDGRPGQWAGSRFGTSLLDPGQWRGAWLVPAQTPTYPENYTIRQVIDGEAGSSLPPEQRLQPPKQVRQDVEIGQRPVRARLYATAKGIFRLSINGRDLVDRLLEPGFDAYTHRLAFSCHDVTDILREGTNTVGMVLADGWWAGRVGITGSSAQFGDLLAGSWHLSITFPDGTTAFVGSGDSEAFSARGGWDHSDIFIGERFDARAATPGWSEPGHPDGWQRVERAAVDTAALTPFSGEPVRRLETIRPVEVEHRGDGSVIVDLGQVVAGRLRLEVEAGPGTEIILEHSEVLNPDGSFFNNILGPNKDQCDVYVCSGAGIEVYEPSFTFHGFRYARLSSPRPFRVKDVAGVAIGTDLRRTAELITSDPLVNRFHQNVLWSQRANFLSIPTDCPQRERAGWTGDLQVFIHAAATTMDVRQFVERWLANLRAEQFASGGVPVVVPQIPSMDVPRNEVQVAAGWSDAVVLVPWALWQRYEDRRALEENYEAMRRWVEFQHREAGATLPERLREAPLSDEQRRRQLTMWNSGWQFGDWLAPSTLSATDDPQDRAKPSLQGEIVAAMFHAHSTAIVADVAAVLGEGQDAASYAERAASIRAAFAAEYVAPDGRLLLERQGLYVLALAFGVLPEELREAAVGRLLVLIDDNDGLLDTGFLSTPHLLDVLWEAGEKELARSLFWQTRPPSWLYPVTMGATTVWESWDAVLPDGTPTASSMNHYALGCVDDWLFRRQAGIAPTLPGYATVRLEPDLDGPLSSAVASVETVRGTVSISWRREGGVATVSGSLPPGVCGELALRGRTVPLVGGSFSEVNPDRDR